MVALPVQWKKLVNAFRLRLLIHLSKKESNTNLNIKSQFQTIISNPAKYPLFASNADNAQIVFNTTAPDNYYPDFGYLSLSTAVSMEKGFVKILKDRKIHACLLLLNQLAVCPPMYSVVMKEWMPGLQ